MPLPFQIPYIRKSYPALGNPVFVDDLVAVYQLIFGMFAAQYDGFGTNFAIVSGFEYNPSPGPGSAAFYNPGILYLQGAFMYVTGTLSEGLAIAPVSQDINPQPFSDTNSRNTYTLLQGESSSATTGLVTPIFTGNMNPYRMNLAVHNAFIVSLLATQASLGGAAKLNVGTTINTVAAGNDPRLVYTAAQLDARYAQIANVIIKGGGTAYTPAAATDPTNVGWVQENFPQILASGSIPAFDIPGGGITQNLAFGTTLNSTNYIVMFNIISHGTPQQDTTAYTPTIFAATTAGCSMRFQEGVGGVQNISVNWIVLPMLNY